MLLLSMREGSTMKASMAEMGTRSGFSAPGVGLASWDSSLTPVWLGDGLTGYRISVILLPVKLLEGVLWLPSI